MTTTDHRSPDAREQAQEYAEQARTKMDDRRADQGGGLSGWLAKRAGEWDLSGADDQTMQRQ